MELILLQGSEGKDVGQTQKNWICGGPRDARDLSARSISWDGATVCRDLEELSTLFSTCSLKK